MYCSLLPHDDINLMTDKETVLRNASNLRSIGVLGILDGQKKKEEQRVDNKGKQICKNFAAATGSCKFC